MAAGWGQGARKTTGPFVVLMLVALAVIPSEARWQAGYDGRTSYSAEGQKHHPRVVRKRYPSTSKPAPTPEYHAQQPCSPPPPKPRAPGQPPKPKPPPPRKPCHPPPSPRYPPKPYRPAQPGSPPPRKKTYTPSYSYKTPKPSYGEYGSSYSTGSYQPTYNDKWSGDKWSSNSMYNGYTNSYGDSYGNSGYQPSYSYRKSSYDDGGDGDTPSYFTWSGRRKHHKRTHKGRSSYQYRKPVSYDYYDGQQPYYGGTY